MTSESCGIVIVGAGIAGLATALAFHRLGLKTLVLEQSDKLRAGGTSISLWENAWHALDALGISDELRKDYLNISCAEILSEAGKLIQHVSFSNGSSHELRAVERIALVKALAKPLPKETIRFNSKVEKISKAKEESHITIYLEDETTITSEIVVGCDGVHSAVAKWMGVKEPSFVGQYVIRGLMVEPEGMKAAAKTLLEDWSNNSKGVMYDLIDNSPLHTLSISALRDRWDLPFFPKLAINGGTLAGDALHPMTHNLAQGGCLALEDGVILARGIYTALKAQKESSQGLYLALETYVNERWKRFLPLTILSHIMGVVMTLSSPLICYLRDNFVLQFLLRARIYSRHTCFDCGDLLIP